MVDSQNDASVYVTFDPVTLVFYDVVGTSLSYRISVERKGKISILPQSLVGEHLPDAIILQFLSCFP